MLPRVPEHSKHRKIVFVVVACGGLLGIGAVRGYPLYQRHRAATEAGALRRCLLGSTLEPGERPSARIHRIALAGPPSDWPARCQKYAPGLDLARIEERPAELHGYLERLADESQQALDVPAAPPAIQVADPAESLVPSAIPSAESFDPVPGADLHFIVDLAGGKIPWAYCEARAPLSNIQCHSVTTAGMRSPLTVWPGTRDGGPMLAADANHGWLVPKSIVRLDRNEHPCTQEQRLCTAFGQSDGSVLVVSKKAAAGDVFDYAAARETDAALVDLKWTMPSIIEPSLFGDRLVWIERDHLFARRVTLGTPLLTPIEDLGELAWTRFHACFTAHSTAIYDFDEDGFAVFLRDTGHSPIHRVKLTKSDYRPWTESVTCGKNELTSIDMKSDVSALRWTRCTDAGCVAPEIIPLAGLTGFERYHARVQAVALGDRAVVLWSTARLGVRFRIAKPSEIAGAPDHLLYDDYDPTTGSFSVHSTKLVARHDAAIALLGISGSKPGLIAFRIAPDGAVDALRF
jgi:hypothetical protein